MYSFKIPGVQSLGFLSFIDNTTLCYYSNKKLVISRLNCLGDCFAVCKTMVRKLLWIRGNIGVLGEDNSVILYSTAGHVVTTVYPPPTANDVKDIFYIDEIQRLLLLLYSGSICLFKCEGETGLLVQIIYTGDIKVAAT